MISNLTTMYDGVNKVKPVGVFKCSSRLTTWENVLILLLVSPLRYVRLIRFIDMRFSILT